MRIPIPGLPSSRIPNVRGDPLRTFPRHPLDEAPAPVKNSGGPLGIISWQAQMWSRRRGGGHLWVYQDIFPKGSSRTFHRVWCLFEGVPGECPEGVPPGPRESVKKETRGLGTRNSITPLISCRVTLKRVQTCAMAPYSETKLDRKMSRNGLRMNLPRANHSWSVGRM